MSRKSPLKKGVISEKDYYKNYGKQEEIVAITLSYFFNIGLYLLVSYKKCAKSMSYKLYFW